MASGLVRTKETLSQKQAFTGGGDADRRKRIVVAGYAGLVDLDRPDVARGIDTELHPIVIRGPATL